MGRSGQRVLEKGISVGHPARLAKTKSGQRASDTHDSVGHGWRLGDP